ncbi:MAG: VTT domain-containing protein [Oligosphaeraceae bacterium]|nr:VTT domain-containing protein [Oligosphaeraceae bacterium]
MTVKSGSKNPLPGRILLFTVLLALFFLLCFALWGDGLEASLSVENYVALLRRQGAWGWLIGIFLLITDLILPIPATGVMCAFGIVYGFWAGWVGAAIGSMLAALLGYALARLWGDKGAAVLAKPEDLQEFRQLFKSWGDLAIILSRALPILPEVMSVLAGLAKMPLSRFVLVCALGSLPVSAVYCAWGSYMGAEAPVAAFLVAIILPALLWTVFKWAKKSCKN